MLDNNTFNLSFLQYDQINDYLTPKVWKTFNAVKEVSECAKICYQFSNQYEM